jgi:HAD superfamily hydrolase (TIGR01490 family)
MGRIAAVFDVDRTLIRGTSMESLFVRYMIARGELNLSDLGRYLGFFLKHIDELGTQLNKRNKAIWEDKEAAKVHELAERCFSQKILPRLSDLGRDYIERHREKGHLIVLLSGSLDFLVEMLKEELDADHMIATRLAQSGPVLAGRIEGRHPWGDNKKTELVELSQSLDIDLPASYAYGDHHADVPILELVGNPVAVNPTIILRREALHRGWPIVNF